MNKFVKSKSSEEPFSIELRPHQKNAIDIAYKLLVNGQRKVLLELAAGTGKSIISVELANRLLESGIIHNVLVLTNTLMMAESLASAFYKSTNYLVSRNVNQPMDNQITIITYSKLRAQASITDKLKYDLIICDEAQLTKNEKINHIFQTLSAMFVGIISPSLAGLENRGWFKEAPIAFTYSTKDSEKDGFPIITRGPQEYGQAVVDFLSRLLQQFGYHVIKEPHLISDYKFIPTDILASSKEQKVFLEVKAYRDRVVSKNILDTAINQMLKYKNLYDNSDLLVRNRDAFCLVLLCEIGSKQKERISEQFGIAIWDISNMLYICKENTEFLKELNELIYFSIADIAPEKPYGWMPEQVTLTTKSAELSTQIIADSLEERLRACKEGKEKRAFVEYENICTDIIQFLFENEFTQSSNQHKTGDDLFRMDLLCGIKGSSAFWELLIKHYNTRFVVFEYKNYSTFLPQNLIYVTEKYLFDAALRNVAIIVSRKGFSPNARQAALGCLKESGKLIVELTDEDLIQMLHKKVDGEEAADYLLWKLECLLMSVGK